MNVGAVIVDQLTRCGVTHFFGVPGEQAAPLYAALVGSDLRYVVMRDERNAVYAADAFARLTRHVAVVDATAGAGAVNLPAGLAEAYNSSIPVLALVTNVAMTQLHLIDRGRVTQGVEQLAMLRPLAKAAFRVTAPATLPSILAEALRIAVANRPGPIVIEVPRDVMSARIDEPIEFASFTAHTPLHRAAPPRDAVTAVAAMLAEAERPLLVAGGGVLLSGAQDELLATARACGAAVATTLSGKGAILETDPAFAGVIGTMGHRFARTLCDAADAVLLIGFKWGETSTYDWHFPNRRQGVAWLDIDGSHGASRPVALGLVADAREGLRALNEVLAQQPQPGRTLWLEHVAAVRASGRNEERREETSDVTPLTPQRVVSALSKLAGPNDVFVCDASFASGWGAQHFTVRAPGQRTVFPRGMAGPGYGVGAAIGAALSGRHEHVWMLAGDAALAYALGELSTIANHKLPISVIVLNDRSSIDFAAVAAGVGLDAKTVTNADAITGALEWASSSARPCLLDVATDVLQTPLHSYGPAPARPNLKILPKERSLV